jgi:hypothetical protein
MMGGAWLEQATSTVYRVVPAAVGSLRPAHDEAQARETDRGDTADTLAARGA